VSAHYRTRRVVVLAEIAAMVLLPAIQNCSAQDATTGNHWNVTFHAGVAPIRPESTISASIEDQNLLLRVKKGPEFAIPLNQITAVSSSVTGHYGRVSLAEAKFVDSMAPRCSQMDVGCGAVVITAWLLILPSYPIKTTDRLVQIVWRDQSLDEEIVLKLRKNDYAPFLAQLEKATARPWKNVHSEWAKVQQELKVAEPSKLTIRLERRVKIATSDLEPGTYQIVLLERESNRGELYFFPGNAVDTERLAAVALVRIEPSAKGSSLPQVDYKQGPDGKITISALQVPSKVLRFP